MISSTKISLIAPLFSLRIYWHINGFRYKKNIEIPNLVSNLGYNLRPMKHETHETIFVDFGCK